jgi:hypothetical protein
MVMMEKNLHKMNEKRGPLYCFGMEQPMGFADVPPAKTVELVNDDDYYFVVENQLVGVP